MASCPWVCLRAPVASAFRSPSLAGSRLSAFTTTRSRTGRSSRSGSMTRGAGGGKGGTAAPEAVEQVLELLRRHQPLPKAVVFDLDYTIWNCWCEMYTPSHTPPLYPHVPAILDGLRQAGILLAVASRTPTPHVANAFLDKSALRERFHSIQLIPASSGYDSTSAQKDTEHLPRINAELGVPYQAMLFFDDEHKNVKKVSRLGVTSILVDTSRGVDLQCLEQGLQAFAAAAQEA